MIFGHDICVEHQEAFKDKVRETKTIRVFQYQRQRLSRLGNFGDYVEISESE